MAPLPKDNDLNLLLETRPYWRTMLDEVRMCLSRTPEVKLDSPPIAVPDIWGVKRPIRVRILSVAVHALVLALGVALIRPTGRILQPVVENAAVLVPFVVAATPPSHVTRLNSAAPAMPAEAHTAAAVAPVMSVPTSINPLPQSDLSEIGSLFTSVGLGPVGSLGTSSGPAGPSHSLGGGGCEDEGDCVSGPGVTEPIPITAPDPEYSNAARVAKIQCTMVVTTVVGADGRVKSARVAQPCGYDLDEEAEKAVMKWLFRPATLSGIPVPVKVDVVVHFSLY